MQVKWFKELKTEEEKAKRKKIVLGNKEVLDILVKICYNSIEELDKKADDFSVPNWALNQANLIGYKSCLKDIIKMCDLTNEKDH